MARPHVLILRAPGTNCDLETAFAFERAGALAERLHVNALLENPRRLAEFQVLCLPGGFSYGDDLGAGTILGNQIRHHLAECLRELKAAGKLVLGICNGFQILLRSGILLDERDSDEARPGSTDVRSVSPNGAPVATLTFNASGKFEDRWVRLKATGGKCVFFAGIDTMYLPVAHAEGRFVPRDAATLAALEARGQLALRYASAGGETPVAYPENPNGAVADVAGVCDVTGRVCGLMPHPERHIDSTHHPRWTRGALSAEGDGLKVFRNAVAYFS
ncbi:MAG TPA: phosphoribosylformylglycinamidine synthase I [Pirellulales bacterium]|jgi:phosphoribosylformylglycinamidine synthase|nr:phosphoribosylformylglycinamidine synthase I [Pirellulales bacterium]